MGRLPINLIGQKFGRLTVIERDYSRPIGAGKSVYWKCLCDCGNYCSIRSDKLRNNITKSCGCLSREIRSNMFLDDLTGRKFGKLTVIERDNEKPKGSGHFAYWKCRCQCGKITSVRSDHLKDNTIIGCGCGKSVGEQRIKDILDKNNIRYQQEYIFNDLKVKKHLRFDFAIFNDNNNLVCLIEYQGEQHYIPYHFDTEERFQRRKKYDLLKKKYCQQNNLVLVEIPYTDLDKISIEYLRKRMPQWDMPV